MVKRYQVTQMGEDALAGTATGRLKHRHFWQGPFLDFLALRVVDEIDDSNKIEEALKNEPEFRRSFRRIFEEGFIEEVPE